MRSLCTAWFLSFSAIMAPSLLEYAPEDMRRVLEGLPLSCCCEDTEPSEHVRVHFRTFVVSRHAANGCPSVYLMPVRTRPQMLYMRGWTTIPLAGQITLPTQSLSATPATRANPQEPRIPRAACPIQPSQRITISLLFLDTSIQRIKEISMTLKTRRLYRSTCCLI